MSLPPPDVLARWSWPTPPAASEADSGLINRTWIVRCGDDVAAVLQRLNTQIFDPCVHDDIEAVTAHLAARDIPTPRLIRTVDGGLWHDDGEGGAWRCLTPVGEHTVHKLHSAARARSAGRLVARAHAALRDLDWAFRSVRPGAHDTPAHMGRLGAALEAHRGHRLYDDVARVADGILGRWSRWSGPTDLPERVIHGDLKISNVRFAGDDAVALVDLDTFQVGTLQTELGDAFRSWCNPATEEQAIGRFDLAIFDAAIQGYAAGAEGVTEAEWASIVPGIERICVELAARFACDALEERYFGWDARFGGRGEHNLLRARGQLDLARTAAHAAPHAQRKLEQARAQRLAST